MSATPSQPTDGSERSISQPHPSVHTTSTLLRIGVSAPPRPVDELLARLDSAEGAKWLCTAMAGAAQRAGIAAANPDSIADMVCGGQIDAAQLEALKDHGKRLLKAAVASNERCTGLAAYFISIAAALRHHDTLIGARRADGGSGPRDELHEALLDLAAATEHPWSAMLGEAAMRASDGRR